MNTDRTDEEFSRELCDLIKAEGISSLTVGDIAKRLRCSRRRLYDIAQTKGDLFLYVASRIFDTALRQGHEAAAAQPDEARAIAAYLDVGVATAAELSVAFLNDVEAMREARKLFDDYQTARTSGLTLMIETGVERGIFVPCNAQVVAEVIFGAALRLRRPKFLTQAGLSLEEAFRELYDLLLNGLLKMPLRNAAARRPAKSLVKRAKREGNKGKRKDAGADEEIDAADRLLASWMK